MKIEHQDAVVSSWSQSNVLGNLRLGNNWYMPETDVLQAKLRNIRRL